MRQAARGVLFIGSVMAMVTASVGGCSSGAEESADLSIVTLAPTPNSTAPPASPTLSVTPASTTGTPTASDPAPSVEGETEPTSSTTPWPPSQEVLDEAVLPVSAMPSGWAEVPDDRESDDPCGISISSILDLPEIPSGQAWYAEDEEYGPMVFLSVGVLPPTEVDVLTTLKNGLLECEPPDEDGWSTRYSELSFSPLGDQSIALRITRAKEDTTVYLDLVQARVGSVMVQVAGADVFGNSTAIVEQFAQQQLDRAVDALQ